MPKTIFPINLKKPMAEQELVGHNRWHPDIPSPWCRSIPAMSSASSARTGRTARSRTTTVPMTSATSSCRSSTC